MMRSNVRALVMILGLIGLAAALAGCTSLLGSGLQGTATGQDNSALTASGLPRGIIGGSRPVCSATSRSVACTARVELDAKGNPFGSRVPYGPFYQPSQIRHAYGFDLLASDGTGQTIAIVDAFDQPNIASDLAAFKARFGITGCSLTKVNQRGGNTYPPLDYGWAFEISLDVEWACAIAPGANILLVEADDNSFDNMDVAVTYAAAHASIVSMSWGAQLELYGYGPFEIQLELMFDSLPAVTYIASSGDFGNGVSFPATSPRVVAVGATALPLDSSGNLIGPETGSIISGGGISMFEREPVVQYQYPIPPTNFKRGNPDVAYDGDCSIPSAYAIYDSLGFPGFSFDWWGVCGTSAGAPQWAALIALVNQGRGIPLGGGAPAALYAAAKGANYAADFNDITAGVNGGCGSVCTAGPGYDFVTGVGSPRANNLVPYLQTH